MWSVKCEVWSVKRKCGKFKVEEEHARPHSLRRAHTWPREAEERVNVRTAALIECSRRPHVELQFIYIWQIWTQGVSALGSSRCGRRNPAEEATAASQERGSTARQGPNVGTPAAT